MATIQEILDNINASKSNNVNNNSFIDLMRQISGNPEDAVSPVNDANSIYGHIVQMYTELFDGATNYETIVANIDTITEVFNNLDTINSVDDSKAILESIFADKSKLDSIFADKIKFDRLYSSIDNIDRVHQSIDNVDTVIGEMPNIDTVAGSIGSVNATADSIADVSTVADDIDNVNTTSGSITSVNTVSASISDVNTVASDISNVNTVSTDITNVNTTAQNILDVNTTATNIVDINATADDIASVVTTAGSIASVNTVSADITNVNTVATNIAAVNTVADANNLADVIRVADDLNSLDVNGIADITTVANDLVQGVDSDIITVSENITDITTVAGNLTSINNLLLVTDDITTLASVADDIDALGPVAKDITAVADNLTSINGFSQKYIISDTAPIDNTEGRLWYDSVNDIVKVWNGTGWQETSKAVEATHNRYSYVAVAGQQVFTASYNAGYVDVFYNGMKLQDGVDYFAVSSTYIQLVSAANAGDIVDIIGYAVVSVLDETFSAPTTTSIQFNGGTGSQGTVVWNTEEETLDLDQGGATLQLGQEIQISCQNNTASTIPDGTVVMATGSSGASGKINVAPYDGVSDIHFVLGVTTEEIAASDIGKVTSYGKVRGLDTTAFGAGDILYTTTSGALTNVKPTSGIINPIAFVLASHANNGSIMVRFTPVDDNQYYTKTEVDTEVAVANGNALAFAIALG